MTDRHQILRSTRLVTLVTLLSRVFGYVRDLAIATLLGTGLAADCFVIAFRIPNLFRRLMAEGAMTGAFIPVFTAWRAERPTEESWDFARRMFWTLATIGLALTIVGVIAAPWLVRVFTLMSDEPQQWSLAVLLTRITFPYCVLIALTAMAGATLNSLRVFGLPASVPIYLNLAMIGAAVAAWRMELTEPAVALAVGVILGGVLQVGVQLPALARRGMKFGFGLGFRHPGIRRVGRLMLPAFAGVGIYQVNVLVSTMFASQSEGWISALYFADRLMEVALGVYAISVATVVLPLMSQQATEKRVDEMRSTLTFALRNVAFIVVPAAVGLIVLRDPLVRVLFEYRQFGDTSTELTSWALLFYAIGLPGIAATRLVVPGFYAIQDTATPVRVAAVALVVNVALCFLLVGPLRHGGLALATSLAAYVNFFVLYWLFRRRLGAVEEGRVAVSLARTLLAAGGMGVACWWLSGQFNLMKISDFSELFGWFSVTLLLGVVLYLGLAWILRAEELGEVYVLVTGRRLREGSD